MKVVIKGTDITQYINESSYKMDATRQYKSWNDGNKNEHRIYVNSKVSGSFIVALYKDDFKLSDFLTLWNSAVSNDVITLSVWVNNLGQNKTIQAFYEHTMKKSRQLSDGRKVELLEVKLEEC